MQRLHLGSGARIIPGWWNADFDPPADATPEMLQFFEAHDLTLGLPFEAATVDRIFSEHTLEHFTRHDAVALLRECHRVMAPGGIIRVSVPSLRRLVDAYVARDLCFADVVGWRPATPAQLLNEGMRMWGHVFIPDADELLLMFREAGWAYALHSRHGYTLVPEMPTEGRPNLGDLVIEAMR